MTLSDVFSSLFLLAILFIYFYIWFSKKTIHKVRKTIILTVSLTVFAGMFFLLDNIVSYNIEPEWYHQIDFSEEELPALSWVKTDIKSYLIYENGEEVTYQGVFDKNGPSEHYQVIYFNEMDDIYVVIYSYDIRHTIEYNRFVCPDYQAEDYAEDRLYVIDRSSGKMISIVDYDLVGFPIDLLSFKIEPGKLLSYAVFQPFQDKIRNVNMIFLDEDSSFEYGSLLDKDVVMSVYHFYSDDDPSWITYYAVSTNMSVWADSYGEVHGYHVAKEGTGYSGGSLSDSLFDNSFIVPGYILTVNDIIYFLGVTEDADDIRGITGYSIFRLASPNPVEVVRLTYSDELEDISTVSDWVDSIPE